jgi:hypothetical protein
LLRRSGTEASNAAEKNLGIEDSAASEKIKKAAAALIVIENSRFAAHNPWVRGSDPLPNTLRHRGA